MVELYKQDRYDKECKGDKTCMIIFVPNISDTSAEDRKKLLAKIEKVAHKNRKEGFEWAWLQAGDQEELESALNIGEKFPAIIAT